MPETWLAFREEPRLIPSGISFKAMSDDDMAFLSELYRTTRWEEVMQAPWDDDQRLTFLQRCAAAKTHSKNQNSKNSKGTKR